MNKITYYAIGAVSLVFVGLMIIMTFNDNLFDSRKEIRFWHFWDNTWMQPAIDKFEALYPNYKITPERLIWQEGRNKIIASLAADDAPDVIEIGSTWVAGFGKDGGLLEIDRGDTANTLSNWSSAYFDGKYYAYPWVLSTNAMFYNKTLLKNVGIDEPPKNWMELKNAVMKIHAIDRDIYGYGLKTGKNTTWQKFLPFAWSNNARLISEDWKTTHVADSAFVDALTFYKQLKEYGLYDENVNVRNAFQAGTVGFMLEDPGQIKKFRKETPDLDFGVILLPKSPAGRSVNFAGAEMLAVTKNAADPKMAMTFIKFLLQPENTLLITRRVTTLFPAHKDAVNDPFYANSEAEVKLFLRAMKQAVSPPAHPEWERIQEILTDNIERVMYDKATPTEAMREAKKAIQPILDASL